MIANKHPLRPGFLILLCLFNCALLLHLGIDTWPDPIITLIVALMVAVQFLNYRVWWPTMISIIICLYGYLTIAPRLANHFNTELIAGLIILLFFGYRYLRIKNPVTPNSVSLTLRLSLITIYFIAGFHKLNSGFFSIDGSCAAYINLKLFGEGNSLPDALVRVLQVGTIIIEMVVPFGLLHHKLRKPTVFLLALFHLYLALCNFSNFSAFAVFLLIGTTIDLSETNFDSVQKGLKAYIAFCLAAVFAGLLSRYFYDFLKIWQLLRGILFCIGFAILCKTFLYNKTLVRQPYTPSTMPVLTVILLALWGLQPYVGLSTGRNFNMFCNLVTEKSRNNHYLIDTQKTKIWDFEEELVTVVQLPKGVKTVNQVDPAEYDIPLIEFKRAAKYWVHKNAKASCTIIYKGRHIHIANLKTSEFSKTKWWHRFLFYRPVPKKGTNPCRP